MLGSILRGNEFNNFVSEDTTESVGIAGEFLSVWPRRPFPTARSCSNTTSYNQSELFAAD